MRLFKPFIGTGILFRLCLAQHNDHKSSEAEIRTSIMSLPQCCMNCVIPTLTHMSCNISNLASFAECFCSDIDHQKTISECTYRSCSFQELMVSENILQVICRGQIHPTRQPQMYIITSTICIFVIIFVALRCYSNYLIFKKFWWDDVFLLISTMFFLAFQCLTIWGTSYGFGLHLWSAKTTHWRGLLLFQWIWELIYIIVQTMTKVSVLLLYFRIFPQVWFRNLLFVLIAVMFLHCIVFGGIVASACKPISKFWNRELNGNCIDIRSVGLVGAAFSIVEDLVFLCLPIPLIWRLKLKTSRKVGISLILTIGFVACTASIVRLRYLVEFNQSFDQTWDNFNLTILSQIELSLSIICVCFPAIRLFFIRATRNINESSRANTISTPSPSVSVALSSPSGLLTKILSLISSNTSHGTLSIPWISSRAPQLSSIYITSHIELSDKDPTISDANTKEYETHIAASRSHDTKKFSNKIPFLPTSEIIHVDKTGTLTAPFRKFTDSVLRGENKKHDQQYSRPSSQDSDVIPDRGQ